MQSKPEHLYEYAVVRYLPCVEREEFINVGLIMMCKRQRWIKAVTKIDPAKVSAYRCRLPLDMVERQLESFCLTAAGVKRIGEMAMLPVEERFRWLTAVRSSCIQTSRPHPGLTDNLNGTFAALFDELVN